MDSGPPVGDIVIWGARGSGPQITAKITGLSGWPSEPPSTAISPGMTFATPSGQTPRQLGGRSRLGHRAIFNVPTLESEIDVF